MKADTSASALLKETWHVWQRDGAHRLGAALAFYILLSVLPLSMFLIRMLGALVGEEASRDQVYESLRTVLGPQASSTVQGLLTEAATRGPGAGATILGLVILAYAASRMFLQMRRSLDTMWAFSSEHDGGIRPYLVGHGLSLALTAGVGLLLLLLFALSAVTSAVVPVVARWLPVEGNTLLHVADAVLSLLGTFVLVAAIYRFLPRTVLPWRVVAIGAGMTSVLFLSGKLLLGFYLRWSSIGSLFGTAGSLMVLLLWVFYIAQVFFAGVSFTKAYERRRRHARDPKGDAERSQG